MSSMTHVGKLFTGRARAGKAIALLSGGLDSTLAISALLEQGLEVLALNFTSPFCTCSPRKAVGCHLAGEVARELGIEIRVMAKGMDYLKIVEKPRFGRGRGLNPCIDCRIYILRKAAELMPQVGASFVVTGEVLGQRPMSQHRAALELIERESGLAGRLLRPLSAHLLPPTIPELEGLVQREKLLAISGRSRKPQLELAEAKGIETFGCAAGGCLLTDPNVAYRLQDVFDHVSDWGMKDAKLATFGRHLRLHPRLKIILGRDLPENERLLHLAGNLPRADFLSEPGPTAVLRGEYDESDLVTVGRVMRHFAKKASAPEVELQLVDGPRQITWLAREPASPEAIERWTI